MSRNRVIKKHLPDDLGGQAVFCSPDALLSMWKPGWRSDQARNLFQWARVLVDPGSVVWDIGANQGLFAFPASFKAGRRGHVVAFEPDLFLAGLLERSLNKRKNGSEVTILPIAISGRNGIAEFAIASKDRALNYLAEYKGNPHTNGIRRKVKVLSCTIDWLSEYLPEPDIIKIDVEGAEADVLAAAENLLVNVRPTIIVEVSPENEKRIGDIFSGKNYRLLDSRGKGEEISNPAWNTVAVPHENFDFVAERFRLS